LLKILQQVSSLAVAPQEKAPRASVAEAVFAEVPMEKQGTLVAVFSPRGGAGCSTLAVNLAIALQGQRKAKVLVIDGNLRFGALDAILNLQGSRCITDMLRSLEDGDPELIHNNAWPHSSGIRVLAAPPSPEMADLVSVKHLAQVVALSRMRYDYVVADVPSGLDERALYFLDVADCIFELLTPDIPAIKNTRSFLELAHRLRYPPEKIHLVLNRVDPRGGLNANAIQRHLRLAIVASIPDIPRVAQAAINRGVPLILYERTVYKEMPVTRQVLALADMVPQPGLKVVQAPEMVPEIRVPVITSLPKAAPQPQKRGLLDRFLGRR
jgi:pilus assembly protein CpaE